MTKGYLKVLNYTPSVVCLETKRQTYTFAPCEDGIPSFESIAVEDIEYINGISPVFRSGILRFEDDVEAEVFEMLRIQDYKKSMWTESDIDDVLTNPTEENQNRLIEIRDTVTMDRVRSRMIVMQNRGSHDVSTRVNDIVLKRYDEIMSGRVSTALKAKRVETAPTRDEMTRVEKQNEELKKQIDLLMEALDEMKRKPAKKKKE